MRVLSLALLLVAPSVASQTLQDARALFQNEQWAEARDAYQQIAEREPENGRAWYWLGRSQQQVGDDEAAIDAFRQLEALGAAPPIVQVHLAGSYVCLGDADAALAAIEAAASAGFANVALLEGDPLLEPLRGTERYAEAAMGVQRNATPCMYSEPHRQLDFWVGSWEVRNPQGVLLGTNEIELAEQGCYLTEHWTAAGGGTGSSINYYDPATGLWNQLWIAAGGGQTSYRGSFTDGAMRFEGTQTFLNGTTAGRRMTFTPNADGSVRQFIEASTDGGETWTVAFDGTYIRKTDIP